MTRYNFYQRGGTGRTAAVSTRAAQTGTVRASAYPGYLISVGSSGEYVRQIQRCLNNVSSRYPSIGRISEDGVFGQATRNAVIAFQQAAGLKADGIVGSATWNRLSQECGGQSGGSGGSTDYPGYVLTVGSTGSAVTRVQQSLNTIYSGTSSVPRLAEVGSLHFSLFLRTAFAEVISLAGCLHQPAADVRRSVDDRRLPPQSPSQPLCGLRRTFRAEDEVQTRDPQLGRLMLYRLSYFRKIIVSPESAPFGC